MNTREENKENTQELPGDNGERCFFRPWLVCFLSVTFSLGIALCLRLSSEKYTIGQRTFGYEFIGRKQAGVPDIPPIFGDKFGQIKEIISSILLDKASLIDLESPQSRALWWIAMEDGASISIEDENRIIQRYVLAIFYFSTGGEDWSDQYSFLSTAHECSWNGVNNATELVHGVNSCDTDLHVRSIVFVLDGLKGVIPGELKELKSLQVLFLGHNSLSGPIPEEIGELPQFRQLFLSGNQMSGAVPESLQDLSFLQMVWVDNNDITGTIEFLCNSLDGADIRADREEVQCSCCDCCPEGNSSAPVGTDAPISGTDASVSPLRELVTPVVADSSTLDDPSSPQWKALLWLEEDPSNLAIDSNDRLIQRFILAVFYYSTGGEEWRNQYDFLASDNECDWGELDEASEITHGVNSCDLSGKVTGLVLASNELKGEVPNEFSQLNSLNVLTLIDNFLQGQIPDGFGDLTAMQALLLSENEFSGTVPQSFANMKSLAFLWLDKNDLTGSVDFLCQDFGPTLDLRVDRDVVSCTCCDCCPEGAVDTVDPEDSTLEQPASESSEGDADTFDAEDRTTEQPPSSESSETVEPETNPQEPEEPSLDFTFDQVKEAILPVVSDVSSLDDPSSPQSRALLWIVQEDEAGLSLTNTDRIIQRYILAVFYYSTGGTNWRDQFTFLSKDHECDWGEYDGETELHFGVSSCNDFMAVTGLILGDNNLAGTIPAEVSKLDNLMILGLSFNALNGSIPTELGELSQLSAFVVASNQLSGQVPQSFANVDSLKFVRIEDNEITGSIDFLCDKYSDMFVQADRMEVSCKCCGCCPEELADSTTKTPNGFDRTSAVRDLITPTLADPGLLDISGSPQSKALIWVSDEDPASVPLSESKQIIQRYNLAAIYYATGGEFWTDQYDFLSGNHECDWGKYNAEADLTWGVFSCDADAGIVGINLISNNLVGSFPIEFTQLPPLSILFLGGNLLSGHIPEEIGTMSNLQMLKLSSNSLTGEIPSSMTSLPLTFLTLDGNQLTGSADFLCNALLGAEIHVDREEVTCSCCACCPET